MVGENVIKFFQQLFGLKNDPYCLFICFYKTNTNKDKIDVSRSADLCWNIKEIGKL